MSELIHYNAQSFQSEFGVRIRNASAYGHIANIGTAIKNAPTPIDEFVNRHLGTFAELFPDILIENIESALRSAWNEVNK